MTEAEGSPMGRGRGAVPSSLEGNVQSVTLETPQPEYQRALHAAAQAWTRFETFVRARPQIFTVLLLGVIGAIALWSRYRYIVGEYTYTIGSGDAQLTMLKALLLSEGVLKPAPELVPTPAIFDQPPLISLIFAPLIALTDMPVRELPYIIVPLLTMVMLLFFFDLVRRTFDVMTALLATIMLALLPRFSFDSTEAEKAPFVISFAVIALWILVVCKGRTPWLYAATFFLALSMFSHVTGYFFAVIFLVVYLSQRDFRLRSLIETDFLKAAVLPIFAFYAYVALSHLVTPDAAVDASEAGSSGLLPGFLQRYADTLSELATGAFSNSAWNTYFEAVRTQLTTPVYIAGLAGLVLAIVTMFRTRDPRMLLFVFWLVFVSVCFAIQYPAASHASRYPSYVTPAFLVLAAYAVVQVTQLLTQRFQSAGVALAVTSSLFLVVVAWPVYSYATAPNPGLRDIYGGYRDVAAYVDDEGLLDDGSHLLYLGWPSITMDLLERDISYQHRLHTFGFGLRDLEKITPQFIEANNIRYYIDTRAGSDGFDSSAEVLAMLQANYKLVYMGRFEHRPGNYAVLYRIEPARLAADEELVWRGLLDARATELKERSLLFNPELDWGPAGVHGWAENGSVELRPFDGASGVTVDNTNGFGGIRQTLPPADLPAGWVTFVAEVQAVSGNPARSAVPAAGYAGVPPISQVLGPLTTESSIVVLELELPQLTEDVRFTIATGEGDTGDLSIVRAYALPGRAEDALALLFPAGQ